MGSSVQMMRWTCTKLAEFRTLLCTMRFAVSVLMGVALASIIGTVLVQNQTAAFYLNQFGPFWWALFDKFGLAHVYSSGWFLLMVGFLLISTLLCLINNTPRIVSDALSFREHFWYDAIKHGRLPAFAHRIEFDSTSSVAHITLQLRQILQQLGFAVRERRHGIARVLAAKKGSSGRLGYVFAHTAIIVISLGGLLDSELPVQLQIGFAGKQAIGQNMLIRDVPSSGRLSPNTLSFQGNMRLSEGAHASHAIVAVAKGALIQPLPFTLTLKKFTVDYYATGMPRQFTSRVQVQDLETGKSFDKIIEVNQPLQYKGITVYQSGFEDGGSSVQLRAYPLQGRRENSFVLTGVVGHPIAVDHRFVITALQVVNKEDFSGAAPTSSRVVQTMNTLTGSAADKKIAQRRDMGPSVTFRMTDAKGQHYTFTNYMRPVVLDDFPVFLAGVQQHAGEPYFYLRLPADENNSVQEFMQLRAALADPSMRQVAVQQFVEKNALTRDAQTSLKIAATQALDIFSRGGLAAVASFLQAHVPPEESARLADIMVRLIDGTVYALREIARQHAHLPPLPTEGDAGVRANMWTRLAVAALSDLSLYPAPVFLALIDYKQVSASVFQLSRTPGKPWVYLGGLLLILGVFSMLYLRDRRVWVWIVPGLQSEGARVHIAMTSQRYNLDFFREFEQLSKRCRQNLSKSPSHHET